MADQEYNTRTRVSSDLSGCVATEAAYGRLIDKAKELGKKSLEVSKKSKAAFGDLSHSVGFLRKALSGFGVAGLFTGLIAAIGKVKDSFQAAAKQAEAMAKIQQQLGESKAIQSLASQYDRLKDSIAASAAAQTAQLDQIDTDVGNRRKLDTAKMEAAKQGELEALDPEAADYAEQKQKIEAKYAAMGAASEASNAREDLVLQRQRLGVQADTKDQEAEAEAKNAELIRAKINQEKTRQSRAQIASVDLNEQDKSGVFDTIGKTFAQIFTGQWGRAAGATTAEGDAVRQQKAKEAADAELRIAELQDQLRKSEDRQTALKREAGDIRTKRDSMGVAIEAADINMNTARRRSDTAIAAADQSIAKKQKEEADKAEKQSDAERAKQMVELELARLSAQRSAAQQRMFDAGVEQRTAAGKLATAKSQGRKGDITDAKQSFNAAQENAQRVEFEAMKLIKNIDERMKTLNRILDEANRTINRDNSQRLTQQASAATFM